MNNFELGSRLFDEAEQYYSDMIQAYERGSWNTVVRRAQEVVELSLKGLLKMMAIEYPKEHDVGEVFERACHQRGIDVGETMLNQIRSISSQLARERAPAFYMERIYPSEQADEAKAGAERVLEIVREIRKQLE